MNAIEYAIEVVRRQEKAKHHEAQPERSVRRERPKGVPAGRDRILRAPVELGANTVAHPESKLTPASAIKVKMPPPFIPEKQDGRRNNFYLPPRPALLADEARRCAQIEAVRERELIQEAEAAARRRRIARCNAEIAALKAQPDDIPDRAYLVALCVRDWQAEKALLEAER